MPPPYEPYIPQTTGELWDLLGGMMLDAPTFKDETGYFPGRSIETEFVALNGGIDAVRKKVGEERYAALVALSARMRALFEADPEDNTGDTQAGRQLIHEMEAILRPRSRTFK
jgi:hypothetical protein